MGRRFDDWKSRFTQGPKGFRKGENKEFDKFVKCLLDISEDLNTPELPQSMEGVFAKVGLDPGYCANGMGNMFSEIVSGNSEMVSSLAFFLVGVGYRLRKQQEKNVLTKRSKKA